MNQTKSPLRELTFDEVLTIAEAMSKNSWEDLPSLVGAERYRAKIDSRIGCCIGRTTSGYSVYFDYRYSRTLGTGERKEECYRPISFEVQANKEDKKQEHHRMKCLMDEVSLWVSEKKERECRKRLERLTSKLRALLK